MKVTRSDGKVRIDGEWDLVISGREISLLMENEGENPVHTTVTKFRFVGRRPATDSKYRILRLWNLVKLVWPYTK